MQKVMGYNKILCKLFTGIAKLLNQDISKHNITSHWPMLQAVDYAKIMSK